MSAASIGFVVTLLLRLAPPLPTELPPQAVPPPQVDLARVEAALAALPPGPSLADLQRSALVRAQIDLRSAARWVRRARRAAAAPTLSLQYDHRLDRGWSLDQEVGHADSLRDDAGEQGLIRAKATWELDRLIFNPDELRAARAAMDVAELRERVLVEVTRLYFERERLLLEQLLSPPATVALAIDAALRLREIEGLLAGLTGLTFPIPSPAGSAPSPRS